MHHAKMVWPKCMHALRWMEPCLQLCLLSQKKLSTTSELAVG
jgi:hypothetical protein